MAVLGGIIVAAIVLVAPLIVGVVVLAQLAGDVRRLKRRVSELEQRSSVAGSPVVTDAVPATGPRGWAPPAGPARAVPAARAAGAPAAAAPRRERAVPPATPVPPVLPPPAVQVGPRVRRPGAEVTSGQLFAIAGGAFVVIGALLFVTMAISNGWIGPRGQVALGYAFGVALLVISALVGGRRGHDAATLVGVGAGVGIVQLVNVAGALSLDVVPQLVALAVGVVAGGAALAWAVRHDSAWLAGYGIVISLAAPILVDAPPSGSALMLVAVALVASTAAAVRRGWAWLSVLALAVTAPQLVGWATDSRESAAATVPAVVIGWWVVMLVAAIGFDVAHERPRLRTSCALLVMAAAGIASIALLAGIVPEAGELGSLVVLAAAHVVAAVLLGARARARDGSLAFVTWVLVAGSGVVAIVIAEAATGPAQVAYWSLEAVALLGLRVAMRDVRAGLASLAVAMLAVVAALVEAPPWLAWEIAPESWSSSGPDVTSALIAISSIAAGAAGGLVIVPRLDRRRLGGGSAESPALRSDVFIASVLIVLLATSLAWFGAVLGAAFAGDVGRVIGAGIAAAAASCGRLRWRLPALAVISWVLAGAVALDVASTVLTPSQLLLGALDLVDPIAGAFLIAALGVVFDVVIARVRGDVADVGAERVIARAAFAGALLVGSSAVIVTALSPTPGFAPSSQAAQLGLSTWWALVALGGIVAGLARERTVVHRVGAALLALAAAKVLLVDTVSLDSAYRVGTFVAVGLLMLVGGFAYLRAAAAGEQGG